MSMVQLHYEVDEAAFFYEGCRITADHGVDLFARYGVAVEADVKPLLIDYCRYAVGGHPSAGPAEHEHYRVGESHF